MAGFGASKRALALGLEGDDRGGSGLGPARAGRGGLSDRHQMAHDRRRRGRSEIRRLQRRRGRQRHVRRPDADGGRPVPPDRGHGDRGRLGRRDARATSTSAPNIRTRSRRFSGRSSARGRAACSARACSAPATLSISRRGSALAPISAARRRRSWKAWRGSAGRSASSRRCPRSQACSASRRSSTMC